MEKKTFQKPEVKFIQLNKLSILTGSDDPTDDFGGDYDRGAKSIKTSSPKSSTSIPTSSSANWD